MARLDYHVRFAGSRIPVQANNTGRGHKTLSGLSESLPTPEFRRGYRTDLLDHDTRKAYVPGWL